MSTTATPRREIAPERRGDRPCSTWNVTVNAALTATPATSPVDASTPDGRSTETTGIPAPVDPVDHGGRLRARRPVEAGAEERRRRLAALDRIGLDRLAARVAEDAGGDSAVAAVRPPPQTTANRLRTGYTRMAS